MKKIKLTECQMRLFTKLIEDTSEAPDFEDGDVKEYGDTTENGISATIHDDEGNPKYGKMPTADKISSRLTTDNTWSSTGAGWGGGIVR